MYGWEHTGTGQEGMGCLLVCVLSAGPLLRPKSEAENWKLEEGRRGLGELLWRADKAPRETDIAGVT